MKVDFELYIHYDSNEDYSEITQHGYTIKFYTQSIIDYILKKYKIHAKTGIRYRFTDKDLFVEFRDKLTEKENGFCSIFGSDSWPLYQYKFNHIDYWNSIYGEDYFKHNYPEIGIDIWNNSEDLIIEK